MANLLKLLTMLICTNNNNFDLTSMMKMITTGKLVYLNIWLILVKVTKLTLKLWRNQIISN